MNTKIIQGTPLVPKNQEVPTVIPFGLAAKIIAAYIYHPSFKAIYSTNPKEREEAHQVVKELNEVIVHIFNDLDDVNLNYKGKLFITEAICDTWKNHGDVHKRSEQVKNYIREFSNLWQKEGRDNQSIFWGPLHPSHDPQKAAYEHAHRQISLTGILHTVHDKGLLEWFIQETKRDSDDAILHGLEYAGKVVENDMHVATLSAHPMSIALLSMAAFMSHVKSVYDHALKYGKILANELFGEEKDFYTRAEKNVLGFACQASEKFAFPVGMIFEKTDEICYAQGIGSLVKAIGSAWLNIRVYVLNTVLSQLSEKEMASCLSRYPREQKVGQSAINRILNDHAQDIKGKIDQGKQFRDWLYERIPYFNTQYLSSEIKTYAEVIQSVGYGQDSKAHIDYIVSVINDATQVYYDNIPKTDLERKPGIETMSIQRILTQFMCSARQRNADSDQAIYDTSMALQALGNMTGKIKDILPVVSTLKRVVLGPEESQTIHN